MMNTKERAAKIAKAIFDKFDEDKNGTIDRTEAKNIFLEEMKKSGLTDDKFDEGQFERWFEMADANHDNQISFDEAVSFVNGFMLKKD